MKTYAFPGIIEDDILQIAARQIPYMRTAWFSGIMKENERMLLEAIGCQGGRVMFFTSSGTAAMESIVQNYVAAQGKAFIIDGGTFGHRWVQLCQYHGIEHESMQIPFARSSTEALWLARTALRSASALSIAALLEASTLSP